LLSAAAMVMAAIVGRVLELSEKTQLTYRWNSRRHLSGDEEALMDLH